MNDASSTKTFLKVKDRRGNPVLGLWIRNGRYYLQTQLPGDKSPRKIPLRNAQDRPVADLKEAQAAIEKFKHDSAEGAMPVKLRAPGFEDHVKLYFQTMRAQAKKTERTLQNEKATLKHWTQFLGNLPLTHITARHLNDYVNARKSKGLSNRTVNVDILVLNNVLKFAQKLGVLRHRVTADYEALPYKAPKRELRSVEDLNRLCAEALKTVDGKPVYENGQALADYLRLMAYSGARRDSALAVEWADVNWDRRQLCLRKTKYSKIIHVDMNPDLEKHLRDMQSRSIKDAKFLFPSSVKLNSPTSSLKATFELVRKAAGLENFNFHDARHYFISHCVAAGINYLQIAAWVGHSDGGILIGKVYGHLLTNEHSQRDAARVSLSGKQPALELLNSGAGNVQPSVHSQDDKPALAAPVPDSTSADTDLVAPSC